MNQWMALSQKVYKTLLNLYPKAYREEYAVEMLQVFHDESKSLYESKGVAHMLLIWLKIIPDLGFTVVREHLALPTATWGLMEPVPNAPLPWKGVFLVLLPGLVYLIAQIEQFAGNYRYTWIYYRAAFYLMIPVVLVWIFTKRYPIWGLIPLGLFYHLLESMRSPMIDYLLMVEIQNPLIHTFYITLTRLITDPKILVLASSIMICLLLWRYLKQINRSRWVRVWLWIYSLFSVAQVINYLVFLFKYIFKSVDIDLLIRVLGNYQAELLSRLFEFNAVILLVCIGSLFLKRHGFFSIFIYVGYILPIMLVGYPWEMNDGSSSGNGLFIMIGIAVIGYRVLLSVVAPIWTARVSTLKSKNVAIIVSIAMAIVIQTLMHFYQVILNLNHVVLSQSLILSALYIEGMIILGFILAIFLYQVTPLETQHNEKKAFLAEVNLP